MEQKKRLKILFLTPWYPSEENPAAGTFVMEHAMAVSLFNEVTLIAFSESPISQWPFYAVSESIKDGIRTIIIKIKRSPIPNTNSFFHLCAIWKCFRKLIKDGYKPDIIHANIYWAGVYAAILSRLYSVPFVITEHWTGFPMRRLTAVQKIKARFSMNRAKIILPVSEGLRKHIVQYGIKNKFRVVPNTVNTSLFYPPIDDIKRNVKTKRILMVAFLSHRKGISYLLKSLHRIKEVRQDFVLDIVGDGPNRQEYEKLTEKLELGEMVRFHGLKSKPEVADYMRQCDFFVLSSLWENLPCVLIEAMASGIPVIATDVGGVKEMINENVGLLIPPKNTKALEKAIEYMLNYYVNYSPEFLIRYVQNRFGYEAVGRTFSEVYRMVFSEIELK